MEAKEMRVQASPSYLVAAGLGYGSLAETPQQRAYHQHRAAQLSAFVHKFIA